jgi:hypothetical protein
MHGVLFLEFERYLLEKLGKADSSAVKREAGVGARIYVPVDTYPDAELTALVAAAATRFEKPPRLVLEEFGIFVAPQLLKTYRFLVKPDWATLDVLENVETVMHASVRRRTPHADPPRLSVERRSRSEVLIVYTSPRKLCEFARGLIEGLAQFFDETVRISELSCMHERAASCRILVTKR